MLLTRLLCLTASVAAFSGRAQPRGVAPRASKRMLFGIGETETQPPDVESWAALKDRSAATGVGAALAADDAARAAGSRTARARCGSSTRPTVSSRA